ACGQYQDRQVSRPRCSFVPPAARRRGHRVVAAFRCTLLHLLRSPYGTSRTSEDVRLESAKRSKADDDKPTTSSHWTSACSRVGPSGLFLVDGVSGPTADML